MVIKRVARTSVPHGVPDGICGMGDIVPDTDSFMRAAVARVRIAPRPALCHGKSAGNPPGRGRTRCPANGVRFGLPASH
jgi:hypothetical protein